MFGSAIIVFREVLEAALIIAIVMGASRGVAHRGRWVGGGIGLGLAGAVVVAIFAGAISEAVEGSGQEIFNGVVLLVAVAMLAWHNVWMSAHARQLAGDMRRLGHDVSVGVKPLSAMLIVTALAVLREGSETVLFLYGLLASGTGGTSLFIGGMLGLVAGAILGVMIYRGLLHVPLRHFFSVTGWIVLLLAAGLALNAAGFLAQADVLPVLAPEVWDTSHILSQDSVVGQFLHVLIGYNDRPSGIQLVFYIVTLFTILVLTRLFGGSARRQARTSSTERAA
ncbi:MAG: FTR1 family protein [Gammaproteobacteria bacterium]|nr:FTR1 family protein [Gammaproteobacteria bacterium]